MSLIAAILTVPFQGLEVQLTSLTETPQAPLQTCDRQQVPIEYGGFDFVMKRMNRRNLALLSWATETRSL